MDKGKELDLTLARKDQKADMLASQAKALVGSRVQRPQVEGDGEQLPPYDELKALALKVVNSNER